MYDLNSAYPIVLKYLLNLLYLNAYEVYLTYTCSKKKHWRLARLYICKMIYQNKSQMNKHIKVKFHILQEGSCCIYNANRQECTICISIAVFYTSKYEKYY